MSNFARKVKKNNEINCLKTLFGKEPKHRCKYCGRMTLYNKKGECVYCSGEYEKVEKDFMKWLKRTNKKVANDEVKSQ